jgi:hypothetical protein
MIFPNIFLEDYQVFGMLLRKLSETSLKASGNRKYSFLLEYKKFKFSSANDHHEFNKKSGINLDQFHSLEQHKKISTHEKAVKKNV